MPPSGVIGKVELYTKDAQLERPVECASTTPRGVLTGISAGVEGITPPYVVRWYRVGFAG